MLRFAMRHGLVRLIGGRAVPLMWVWDVAMLANKARRIPVVDRTLRRGAGAAMRQAGTVGMNSRFRRGPSRPDQRPRTRPRLVEWHPSDSDRDA